MYEKIDFNSYFKDTSLKAIEIPSMNTSLNNISIYDSSLRDVFFIISRLYQYSDKYKKVIKKSFTRKQLLDILSVDNSVYNYAFINVESNIMDIVFDNKSKYNELYVLLSNILYFTKNLLHVISPEANIIYAELTEINLEKTTLEHTKFKALVLEHYYRKNFKGKQLRRYLRELKNNKTDSYKLSVTKAYELKRIKEKSDKIFIQYEMVQTLVDSLLSIRKYIINYRKSYEQDYCKILYAIKRDLGA